MIYVLASIKVKPGMKDEFLEIFKANVPEVLKEKGCIEYQPAVDIETEIDIQKVDENVVTVIEKWKSLDALDAHSKAPHMKAYHEKVTNIVTDVSLKILQNA